MVLYNNSETKLKVCERDYPSRELGCGLKQKCPGNKPHRASVALESARCVYAPLGFLCQCISIKVKSYKLLAVSNLIGATCSKSWLPGVDLADFCISLHKSQRSDRWAYSFQNVNLEFIRKQVTFQWLDVCENIPPTGEIQESLP